MARYDNPPLHVALFAPEIPPNTGNVSRLCAANRLALHLVEPLGFSLEDKQLKRAGLDYWPEVDCRVHASVEALRAALPDSRFWFFTTKAERTHTATPFAPGDCLLFGRESTGLPEELLAANPGRLVTIPFPNRAVRSLNLSTAVAIGVYEVLRQLRV